MLGFSFNDQHNNGMFFLDHLEEDNATYHFTMGDTPLGGVGPDTELDISKEYISFYSNGNTDFAFHNEKDCSDELLKLHSTEYDMKTVSKVDVDVEHNAQFHRQVVVEHTSTCKNDTGHSHVAKNWL